MDSLRTKQKREAIALLVHLLFGIGNFFGFLEAMISDGAKSFELFTLLPRQELYPSLWGISRQREFEYPQLCEIPRLPLPSSR